MCGGPYCWPDETLKFVLMVWACGFCGCFPVIVWPVIKKTPDRIRPVGRNKTLGVAGPAFLTFYRPRAGETKSVGPDDLWVSFYRPRAGETKRIIISSHFMTFYRPRAGETRN